MIPTVKILCKLDERSKYPKTPAVTLGDLANVQMGEPSNMLLLIETKQV
jgi:hypothetical protein